MFIIPSHGSEVLNRRDQRVFFPLEVARYLIARSRQRKKKPSGTQGNYRTARVKLARVPKKCSANFIYTTPFSPYQKYRAKCFGPRKFSWRHAQFWYKQRWTTKPFVLYLLRMTFHKVQSSTMDTEFGINLTARIIYLKKRKKTRKFFLFLAGMMLTNPAIDRSVWSLRRSSEWLHMAENTFTDR